MRWIVLRGFLGSLLLLVAGLTYSRIPAASSLHHFVLRTLAHHVDAGLLIAFVGMVLLTWAWLDLVRRATGDPDGSRLVRWATAVWTLPLLVAPPLFSNDGWSYVATGFLAGHGKSPYEFTPSILPRSLGSAVDPIWQSTTSPYGPLTLVWGGAASRLSADPWVLLVAQRLLEVGALALLALVVPSLARRVGRDPGRVSALVVASPLVVAHGIGGLHNDLLVAALVAAALAVTRRDRWWWGAVLVGLAAAVKVPGAFAFVGVVLLSLVPAASFAQRVRRTAQVGVVAVLTLLAVSLLSGLGLGWVSGLSRTAAERARLAPTALLGQQVLRVLDHLGPRGHALVHQWHPENNAKHLGLVLLAGIAVWILLRRRIPDDAAGLGAGAAVLVATTLLSPVLHYWYFLWCLPVLACTALARRGERTLIALLVAIGATAVADPAVHVWWFPPAAGVLLVAAPLLAWVGSPWWDARSASVGKEPDVRRTLGRR